MYKYILPGVVILAGVAVFMLVSEPVMPEIDPVLNRSFDQGDIGRGRVLAGIGNCATCHTADPEQPYAGGVGIPTPFGTLYSTNITSHPDQGIGRWSEEAFSRALREGVSRDGSHLYPAFPYTHYSRLSDEDVTALYAFFMTRKPAAITIPANTLEFPYDQRPLLAGWKLLFFEPGRWQPRSGASEQWNRGAYLAEGLGHCSACHSPRNRFGAERQGAAYAGAIVDDWYAPALNSGHRSPAGWTEEELYQYLREGGSELHGVAVGSMSEVIHSGLNAASDADIRALAVYFADKAGSAGGDAASLAADSIRRARQKGDTVLSHGERLYANACASCHFNDPDSPNVLRPDLSLNSAVNAPDPINLIRVTLEGVSDSNGIPGLVMPGFGDSLSDTDIISLVQFLRNTHSDHPAWDNIAERLSGLRQTGMDSTN